MDLNFDPTDLENLDLPEDLESISSLQFSNLNIPLSQPQECANNSVNNYYAYKPPPPQQSHQPHYQPPPTYPTHINGNNKSPEAHSNGHSPSNGKIPNGQNGQIYHQQSPQQVPHQPPHQSPHHQHQQQPPPVYHPQQPGSEAKTFEEKYKEAIESKTNAANSPSNQLF